MNKAKISTVHQAIERLEVAQKLLGPKRGKPNKQNADAAMLIINEVLAAHARSELPNSDEVKDVNTLHTFVRLLMCARADAGAVATTNFVVAKAKRDCAVSDVAQAREIAGSWLTKK